MDKDRIEGSAKQVKVRSRRPPARLPATARRRPKAKLTRLKAKSKTRSAVSRTLCAVTRASAQKNPASSSPAPGFLFRESEKPQVFDWGFSFARLGRGRRCPAARFLNSESWFPPMRPGSKILHLSSGSRLARRPFSSKENDIVPAARNDNATNPPPHRSRA